MRFARVLFYTTLPLLAACGGGGYGSSPTGPATPGTTGAPSTSNAIAVRDNSFSPTATTLPAGTTVTWTWTGSNNHNVTFDDGTKSSTQQTGTFQRTFATAGTYAYHCTIHGPAMSGTVTVR